MICQRGVRLRSRRKGLVPRARSALCFFRYAHAEFRKIQTERRSPARHSGYSDAMDMSLAVAMKIQVVQTPSGGNKITVYGDRRHKPKVLRSIFAAFERLGFIVTSADLGLSLNDLEKYALPVAPTTIVPMGVYQDGIPSALVTADACLPSLQAMALGAEFKYNRRVSEIRRNDLKVLGF